MKKSKQIIRLKEEVEELKLILKPVARQNKNFWFCPFLNQKCKHDCVKYQPARISWGMMGDYVADAKCTMSKSKKTTIRDSFGIERSFLE